jgi:hypothetical protein
MVDDRLETAPLRVESHALAFAAFTISRYLVHAFYHSNAISDEALDGFERNVLRACDDHLDPTVRIQARRAAEAAMTEIRTQPWGRA